MRGLRAIFSYRGDRPSGPHANALPQIVSTRRRKTNTTTLKCGKVGKKLPGGLCGLPGAIEKARQVMDPAGFSLLCGDSKGYVNHLRGWGFGDGEGADTVFVFAAGHGDFIGRKTVHHAIF